MKYQEIKKAINIRALQTHLDTLRGDLKIIRDHTANLIITAGGRATTNFTIVYEGYHYRLKMAV